MRTLGIILLLLLGGSAVLVTFVLVLQVLLSWFGAE